MEVKTSIKNFRLSFKKMVKKFTLFETPGSILMRKSNEELIGEVLTDFPKHPQMMVAASLRNDLDVDLIDIKSLSKGRLEPYGEFNYGDDILIKLRVGASFSSVKNKIEESDFIGITSNYTYESNIVRDFVKYIRNVNPESKILIGGSDATERPDYHLSNGVDVVMKGKSEFTVSHVIKALIDTKSLNEVPGIYYMNNGYLKENLKRGIEKISDLPLPALDLGKIYRWSQATEGGLPQGVSKKVGVLETSRGCNEACPFCATTFQIGLFKGMSLEQIVKNIEHLKKYNIETVVIIDDNILYRVKNKYGGLNGRNDLIKMFDYMYREGFAWTFYNGIQFGLLENGGGIDTKLIDSMFQNNNETRKPNERYIGAFRAYIPAERLIEEEIKKFKKLKPFEIQNTIIKEIAFKKPAALNIGFIIGYPQDSHDSLAQMKKRGDEIREIINKSSNSKTLPYFIPFCLIPIPGTPDYRSALKNQRFAYNINEHPELMNGYASILNGYHFSAEEITKRRYILAGELNK